MSGNNLHVTKQKIRRANRNVANVQSHEGGGNGLASSTKETRDAARLTEVRNSRSCD